MAAVSWKGLLEKTGTRGAPAKMGKVKCVKERRKCVRQVERHESWGQASCAEARVPRGR